MTPSDQLRNCWIDDSYTYIYKYIKKKTTKPITKDYKFISILLRIFEIFKNTKKN